MNIMKLSVNERGTLEIREVFNPIKLISQDNEELIISMRDSGFEINYQGKNYSLKENKLKEMTSFKNEKSSKENIEVLNTIYGDCAKDKTATFQLSEDEMLKVGEETKDVFDELDREIAKKYLK